MKKILLPILLLFAVTAQAQTYRLMPVPHQSFNNALGTSIAPSGFLCTYEAGTTTPLPAYSDSSGTVLPDPIRLNSAGRPQTGTSGAGTETGVYLSGSAYKVNLYAAGTGNTCNGTPVGAQIWSQDNISIGTVLGASVQVVSYATSVTFDTALAGIFKMTLTGNVTSANIANSLTGSISQFTICQDGTGGRTFAWPVTVTTPPVVNSAASSCTSAAFFYDGATWRPWTAAASGSLNQFAYFDSVGSLAGSPVMKYSSTGLTVGGAATTSGTVAFQGSSSGTVTLTAAATAGTFTMTWPTTSGTVGQVLQTAGASGVLSWTSVLTNPLTSTLTMSGDLLWNIGAANGRVAFSFVGSSRIGVATNALGTAYEGNNQGVLDYWESAGALTTGTQWVIQKARGTQASLANIANGDGVWSAVFNARVAGAYHEVGALVMTMVGGSTIASKFTVETQSAVSGTYKTFTFWNDGTFEAPTGFIVNGSSGATGTCNSGNQCDFIGGIMVLIH